MATETRNKYEKASPASERPRQRPSERSEPRRGGNQHSSGPFGLMRQMQDEVDRWFGRLGVDPGWASPSNWLPRSVAHGGEWSPAIEAFQRGNEFVIRAEVPGMSRQELTVEIGDDAITISGERKHEEREEGDGIFWTERSYGSFCRMVPLPLGAISDSAKATFNNGVLEVVMQAPSHDTRRGRKVDISGHDDAGKK